ncbi:MAG: polysaccharide biosynthesis tyrosine autokinase [Bacteroidia bacterium]
MPKKENKAVQDPLLNIDDLRVVFKILRKNWYYLVFLPVLAGIVAYFYTYRQPTIYAAKTRILLKSNEVYDYQERIYSNIGYYGYYGDITNQIRILQSHDIIEATLDKLDFEVSYFIVGKLKMSDMFSNVPFVVTINLMRPDLYDKFIEFDFIDIDTYRLTYTLGDKEFSFEHKFGQEEVTNHYKIISKKREPMFNNSFIESYKNINYQIKINSKASLIDKVKGGIKVENLEYSSILDISLEDEIPLRAKTFLDTLSMVYINYSLQSEFDINEKTAEYIDKQLEEVVLILDTIETELEQYKSSKAILDIGKESQEYFEKYVGYEGEISRSELMLQSINNLEEYILNLEDENLLPPNLYLLENDPFLRSSVQSVYEMQLEKYKSLNSITTTHKSISEKGTTLESLKKDILTYLINTKTAISQKKSDLESQRDFYQAKIKRLPKSQRDLLSIERKQSVNQNLFVFLLEKKANTRIARAGIIPQTKIIERARPIGKVRPDKNRTMYVFIIAGLILASLIAFIRFIFFERIESINELTSITNLSVLGGIPNNPDILQDPLPVIHSSKSNATESFRHLRTNLTYLNPEKDNKLLLVSSIHPGEGKTYISSNLSSIIAKANKKVLLIDFDLHKPKVHKMFDLEKDNGISNFLIGQQDIVSIIKKSVVEGLDVITAGPVPPNASELILSDRVNDLINYARANYDLVVLDTPPIGLISDAVVLINKCDAAIFVMNVKFARKQSVRFLEEIIEKNNLKNIGIALNNIKVRRWKYYSKYGYKYGYAYNYGYGYGYGYGSYTDDVK